MIHGRQAGHLADLAQADEDGQKRQRIFLQAMASLQSVGDGSSDTVTRCWMWNFTQKVHDGHGRPL